MRRIFKNKKVLRECKIFQMLSSQARGRHLSFHTPGHKIKGEDITELSYSDNLSCPKGCLLEAEQDIAKILGSKASFLLTDGSTSGVLAMLHAARAQGVSSIAVCEGSHKSVFNGCALLGITPLLYPEKRKNGIPYQYTMSELKQNFSEILTEADALFFTSPNYYGDVAEFKEIKAYCEETGKLLLVDGAHGGHLHYDKTLHAGAYADLWVDGVHKSLPALTQGAVVSAKTEGLAESLRLALDTFRTTSPSYPIMGSIEYAVKYPKNEELETAVRAYSENNPRILLQADWTKLCAIFGEYAFTAEKDLEAQGIYPEFCDGNVLMFYLSPATKGKDFRKLTRSLTALFEKYPLTKTATKNDAERVHTPHIFDKNAETEWVNAEETEGRICALNFGLFPPCTPLCVHGNRIEKEQLLLLQNANHVFGLKKGKILVYKEPKEE